RARAGSSRDPRAGRGRDGRPRAAGDADAPRRLHYTACTPRGASILVLAAGRGVRRIQRAAMSERERGHDTTTGDLATHPSRYKHISVSIDGDIARLTLNVKEDAPFRPGYVLKLNSYDLGVDIELADAALRLRFEHPQVRCVVVTSGKDRVFSAGANIPMLASS